MKKLLTIMATLVLCVSLFAGCAEDTASNNASKKDTASKTGTASTNSELKTLKVGFDASFPPMGFTEEGTGNYIGFDIDCAKEAAIRLGYNIELVPIAWASKDLELSTKKIDCIWNGFTINAREDLYTWSDAYMNNEQVVVIKKSATYSKLADLNGKRIALQSGSTAENAVNATENKTFKDSLKSVEKSEDNMAALLLLETGSVEGVVMDSIVANYQIAQGKEFKVISEVLSTEKYGVGFLLGNTELRDKVQGALEAMATDGKLAEISKKWFSSDVTLIGK